MTGFAPSPARRAIFAAAGGLAATAMIARLAGAQPAPAPVRLFKAITPRDEVTFGMTAAELERLGAGPDVERIARKLVADGQIAVWQYIVSRAPDGSTRHATSRRVALLRTETLRIEPYTPALPVLAPPAE